MASPMHGIDPASVLTITGPLGDLDGDGLPNLLEHAFNTDPKNTQANPVQSAVSGNYLQLSYPRRIEAVDLAYTVEVSADLSNWSSDAGNFQVLSVTPNGNGVAETVTVRALPALGSTAKMFARVKVSSQ